MLMLLAGPILAQMQPHARYEGKILPVVDYDGDCKVLDKGKRRSAATDGVEIRPAEGFGTGEAIIAREQVDLDPLRNATPETRSKPSSIRFRYEADVSGSVALKDCYGVLVFVANGSIGTHFVSLGSLQPNRQRHVKIELTHRIDSVGHLHIFSNGAELKSNEVSAPYNLRDYFASLNQGSKGVPAVALCQSTDYYPHALSLDGSRLATVRERDSHKSLIVFDVAGSRLLHDVPLGNRGETAWDLTWISDHELVYVSNDDRDYGTTHLILLDVETGRSEQMERDIDRIFTSLKRKPDTLVLFSYRWQYKAGTAKYDVRKRKLSSVLPLSEGTTYFDDDGEERLRTEPDGKHIRYFYRLPGKINWRALDDDVKQPGLRFDMDARNVLDRICQIHSIGPDGDTIYLSTRVKNDRFDLVSYSLSKGVINEVVASHPKYDLSSAGEGSSRLLFRKGSSELIGLIYDAAKPQVVWLDPRYAAVQRVMDQAFPDNVNLPLDWSVDGSTFIYLSSSDRDPGTYYVLRPQTGQLMPLLELGAAFKDQPMGRTTPYTFTARDGGTVHAYVTRPPDQPAGKLAPLVVHVHGGPTARDSWGFDTINQFLATRGYLVLQVNYRGSSGYGAAYQKAGLYSRFDTVILDDIADGVRDLIKKGEVDPERIAVIGGSFGGWATYMSLIKYPELFRSGVAIAAVSHWKAMVRDTGWLRDEDYGAAYWKSLLDRSDFEKSEPFIDPYLRAAELKQPIYVMHGERDYVVRPTEAKLMLEALRKTNHHVESKSFADASHSEWPFASRVTQLNEIEGFLRRTIPPATTEKAASPVLTK